MQSAAVWSWVCDVVKVTHVMNVSVMKSAGQVPGDQGSVTQTGLCRQGMLSQWLHGCLRRGHISATCDGTALSHRRGCPGDV